MSVLREEIRIKRSHIWGKSPSKIATTGASGEIKEAGKGNHPYNVSLTGGETKENLRSKGTIKRKIAYVMNVYHKEISTSVRVSNIPILGFRDSEKIRGIPNKKSPRDHCYSWPIRGVPNPH